MINKLCIICLVIFCFSFKAMAEQDKDRLIIAQGSSTLPNAALAAKQAAEATKKRLKKNKVQYVMVVTSVGYEHA